MVHLPLWARGGLGAALVALITTPLARASVVTEMDTEMLVRESRVIVLGDVESIRSVHRSRPDRIDTYITLRVRTNLKGAPGRTHITLKQPGGMWKNQLSVVFGMPPFRRGERVLVFAAPTRSGELMVTGLFQGKYRIEGTPGHEVAVQEPARRARVLRRPGAVAETHRWPLPLLLRRVRELVKRYPPKLARTRRPLAAGAPLAGQALESTNSFTLLNPNVPLRWFEPDVGGMVLFHFNPANAPLAAPPDGVRGGFEAALSAWTHVTGSSLSLGDGGDTTSQCFASDGSNAISHGDPCDQMPEFDPVACGGVLAIGGVSGVSLETRVLNDVGFLRIAEADVVHNAEVDCFMDGSRNYEEVTAHELGHTVGLGHSCGDRFSPPCSVNPDLDEALMRAFAHADARGASPRPSDINGIRFLYPPEGFVELVLNQTSFTTGDTLELALDLNGTAAVDVYLLFFLPDGSFFALPSSEPGVVVPLAENVLLRFAPDISLGSFAFSGAEPVGNYAWAALLVRAGTDPHVIANWLSLDNETFAFSP